MDALSFGTSRASSNARLRQEAGYLPYRQRPGFGA